MTLTTIGPETISKARWYRQITTNAVAKLKAMSVKLINAKVDVYNIANKKGEAVESLVIKGIIDPESLRDIKIAPYQREVMPGPKAGGLIQALKTSTVPDVDLGMRGDRYRVTETKTTGETDTYHLQDEVFVIDGLQRISAAQKLMLLQSSTRPKIGAMIHLNTTEIWEAERFRALNQDRLKLNINILLRNTRDVSPVMKMIYQLTEDNSFVLHNRVQWQQRMARTEFVTAMALCKTIGILHSRFGTGVRGNDVINLHAGLDRMMEVVGRTTMRDNIKSFFEYMDLCFMIKSITYGQQAVAIKSNFLFVVADLFTRHQDFWNGNRLFITRPLLQKIAKFNIYDPGVTNLAGSSGASRQILYSLLLDHINSSKRTKRLHLFDGYRTEESHGTAEVIMTEEVITGK